MSSDFALPEAVLNFDKRNYSLQNVKINQKRWVGFKICNPRASNDLKV